MIRTGWAASLTAFSEKTSPPPPCAATDTICARLPIRSAPFSRLASDDPRERRRAGTTDGVRSDRLPPSHDRGGEPSDIGKPPARCTPPFVSMGSGGGPDVQRSRPRCSAHPPATPLSTARPSGHRGSGDTAGGRSFNPWIGPTQLCACPTHAANRAQSRRGGRAPDR